MRPVIYSAGAAILLVTVATYAAAQGCPDVTGCWAGDYTDSVSGSLVIVLEQTGDQLSGVETVHDVVYGTMTSSLSGTFVCDTDAIEFSASFASASGQVTGDCMAGTFFVPALGTTGTFQACRASCCGNGFVQPGEACDDENSSPGDGCSETCLVESGWSCVGEPSECSLLPVCGNGFIESGEACDDGNLTAGDGCSATCMVESGFTCAGQPSVCTPIVCGNGILQPGEECDDGNAATGDCCQPDCTTDPAGTNCNSPPPLPGVCDANGHCVAIPTLSQWGVALLSLLMLAAVLYRRRPAIAVDGC